MSRKTELKASVKEKVKLYQEWSKDNKRLLKQLRYIPNLDEFPGELGAFFDDQIHFDTPWDNQTLEKIKAKIQNAGWKCENDERVPENSWRRMAFCRNIKIFGGWLRKKKERRLYFYVYGKIHMDGATCQRVQIGEREEMKTIPIYEIVCEEGAEEMAMEN